MTVLAEVLDEVGGRGSTCIRYPGPCLVRRIIDPFRRSDGVRGGGGGGGVGPDDGGRGRRGLGSFVLVLVAAETDSSPRPERLTGGFGDLSAPETGWVVGRDTAPTPSGVCDILSVAVHSCPVAWVRVAHMERHSPRFFRGGCMGKCPHPRSGFSRGRVGRAPHAAFPGFCCVLGSSSIQRQIK